MDRGIARCRSGLTRRHRRGSLLDSTTRVRCTRETDAGLEVVEANLPAIITADLRLNEPRYVSLPGLIRRARQTNRRSNL